ncbi:MAG: hypothetical protein ABWJ97_02825 [Thermoproteus sp.]
MIAPFVKRAWRTGRKYYGVLLAIGLALTVLLAFIFAAALYTVTPASLEREAAALGIPLEVAYRNFKALFLLLFSTVAGLMASTTAALVAGGSIQADMRNGVYEMLFGNGVPPAELARALLATALSAAAAFYLFAVALVAAVALLTAPEAIAILPALALAALASVVSGAVLIVAVGLAKPNTFKIATGIGTAKELAYTIALAPPTALMLATIPFLHTVDLHTATAVISIISIAMIAGSIGLLTATPRLVNKEELITQAE